MARGENSEGVSVFGEHWRALASLVLANDGEVAEGTGVLLVEILHSLKG